jgi:hypothetical protein
MCHSGNNWKQLLPRSLELFHTGILLDCSGAALKREVKERATVRNSKERSERGSISSPSKEGIGKEGNSSSITHASVYINTTL